MEASDFFENRKLPTDSSVVDFQHGFELVELSTEQKIDQLARDILMASIVKNYPTPELAEQAVRTAKAFYATLKKE